MTSDLTPEPLSSESTPVANQANQDTATTISQESPPPSYVKLAMRNMVRKRRTSLFHFTLTTLGLLAVLIGLSYLTR